MLATDNMTEHRVKLLSALLPFALATGYSQINPVIETLKVRPENTNRGRFERDI